jgi:hypothetical protein
MIDLNLITTIAKVLPETLQAAFKRNGARKKEFKRAVAALQTAVLDTQVYVSALDDGKRPDRTVEIRLVDLWKAAAGAFYGLDGGLAEKFHLKAEYWTDPEAWTSDQIKGAGIALDHVSTLTKQLLYESNQKGR